MHSPVFPETPVYPNEDKLDKMAGTPTSESDSALLAYTNPEDVVRYGLLILDDFEKADTDPKKELVARRIAQRIAKVPTLLPQVFHYWGQRESEDPTKAEILDNLKTAVVKNLKAEAAANPNITDENMQFLLEECSSGMYAKAAEAILAGYFINRKQLPNTTSKLYKLATMAAESGNPAQLKFVVDILSFQTEVMGVGSKAAETHIADIASLDDNRLRDFMELDHFIFLLGPIFDKDAFDARDKLLHQLFKSETVMAAVRTCMHTNKTRFDAISDFIEQGSAREIKFFSIPEGLVDQFPYNLATKQSGPLRRALMETYFEYVPAHAMSEKEVFVPLELPPQVYLTFNISPGTNVLKQLQPNVLEAVRTVPNEQITQLTFGQIKTVCQYLRPEFSDQAWEKIVELNGFYKEQILANPKRFINYKERKLITDPVLSPLEYKSMEFNEIDKNGEIRVTVAVGNYQMALVLDKNLALKEAKSGSQLSKPPVKVSYNAYLWLETVVLAHLYEIMCAEQEEHVGEGSRTGTGIEVVRRKGHIRQLQPGQQYSETQVELARIEQGGTWDLVAMNERRKQLDLQPVTYVRVIKGEEKKVGQEPYISMAKIAMTEINELLKH